MDSLGPNALIFVLILAAVACFVMCHSISVIARKTDHGSAAEILSYIPFLWFAPIIWIGGGSVIRVLIFAIGLILGCVLLMGAATFTDSPHAAVGLSIFIPVALTLISTGYTTLLAWRTATSRELPGCFSLLTWLPGISFFVYPIMAFHDGWARPHRIGGLIGAVLALAFLIPVIHFLHDFDETAFSEGLAELSESKALQDLSSSYGMSTEAQVQDEKGRLGLGLEPDGMGMNADGVPNAALIHEGSIRVLFNLKARFEALDQMASAGPSPETHSHAMGLLEQLRSELRDARSQIDGETYAQLMGHLVRVEAKIQGRNGSEAHTGTIRVAQGQGRQNASSSPPASLNPTLMEERAPLRPFPVDVAEGCPQGAEIQTRSGEKGDEEWCQQSAARGGLRHGWYTRYAGSGSPEQVGEYRDGLRIGVWTRFYPSGAVRAQAEFRAGLQDGWMLSFEESGDRKRAILFEEGTPLR